MRFLIIVAVSILATSAANGQNATPNNRLRIDVSAGYGSLHWTTKYSSKVSSNPQSDPLRDTDFKNTGNASSIDISLLYMIRKSGFGILLGRRNYKIDELISDLSPEITMSIADEHAYLFGGIYNFEIYRVKNFKIKHEIGAGIFSFTDKYVNKAHDNQFFITSQIKLEYQIQNFNFAIAPSYEFVSFKYILKPIDGTILTFKDRANLMKINFGVAYTINKKRSSM